VKVELVKTTDPGFRRVFDRILQRRGEIEQHVEQAVAGIIRDVRKQGDSAIVRYTKTFDGVTLKQSEIEVSGREMDDAFASVPQAALRALRLAARRIRKFHQRQLEKSWSYRDPLGMTLGQRITALERSGVYVPGGKAAYPSTVLMGVIPARVAGVKEIVVASPIRQQAALVLAAARIAGADRVFRMGGAQAIAAMAYGTKTVPQVDKIVGPGNVYVAAAKRLVFGQVDIDSIAGPSEVLLLVDQTANPRYVAADMLSQAEHDELAAAICVTSSLTVARKVRAALMEQLTNTKRQEITLGALRRFGTIFVSRSLKESVEITNAIAPEHVEVMVRQPQKCAEMVRNAGAIFVGPFAPPPLGDYVAGPNHVLPTGGTARFFSPLGTYDFLKRTSMIRADRKALGALAPSIVQLARLEGLDEHARSVEARLTGC
jgi:histidinol dehydrogenase